MADDDLDALNEAFNDDDLWGAAYDVLLEQDKQAQALEVPTQPMQIEMPEPSFPATAEKDDDEDGEPEVGQDDEENEAAAQAMEADRRR